MSAPEGCLVNCKRPAPNCLATITGIAVVNNVSLEAISKMMVASDEYRKEATAVWQGAHCPITVAGYKSSNYVVTLLTQEFGGSGGARTFDDGVDLAGTIPNPLNRTPNIETEEKNAPVLYLFCRFLRDSAGAGLFRGGLSNEYSITSNADGDGLVDVVVYGTGTEYTQCQGFSGGYPGSNTGFILYRGKDMFEILRNGGFPEKVEEIGGSQEHAVWGTYKLGRGEMLHMWMMGGGGYGDPLERDPERVRSDVIQRMISQECARNIYGVVLNQSLEVDSANTESLREDMVRQRLRGWEREPAQSSREERSDPAADPTADTEEVTASYNLSDNLKAIKGSKGAHIHCTRCRHRLSPLDEPWKQRATLVRSPLTRSGPRRSESGRFEMRLYLCPSCGRSLDVEVALPEDPPLHDSISVF